jgi:outer membrane protein assembly factor BamB
MRRRKVFRAHGGVNAVMVALLALAGAACAAPRTIRQLEPGQWTAQLGDVRNTTSLREQVPAAVDIAWQTGIGRGVSAMPIVQGDLIIAPISGGGIATASASTGDRFWTRRFRGAVAGSPLRVDDRVYFATFYRGGTIYSLDLHRGRRIWSRNIDGRTSGGIAFADGVLFVPTDRGEVFALDATNGSVIWRIRYNAVAAQAPIVLDDELVMATEGDSLLRIARGDGAVRARLPLPGMVTAPIVATGDTLILAMSQGVIAAFAERGARELWRHELGAPVLAAPVPTADGIYVLTRTADLFRLNGGSAVRLAELGGAATQSLAVSANGVLVGRLDGTLVFVDRNGRTVWQQQLNGSIRAPALVYGSAVYAVTLAGRLFKLSS